MTDRDTNSGGQSGNQGQRGKKSQQAQPGQAPNQRSIQGKPGGHPEGDSGENQLMHSDGKKSPGSEAENGDRREASRNDNQQGGNGAGGAGRHDRSERSDETDRANADAASKGQQNPQRTPGDQRSSKGDRGGAAQKGGARNASSTGGQQQGGPGSAPFKRADHANDGGSPKNN